MLVVHLLVVYLLVFVVLKNVFNIPKEVFVRFTFCFYNGWTKLNDGEKIKYLKQSWVHNKVAKAKNTMEILKLGASM